MASLFVSAGLGHNGVHQIALVARYAQGPLEVRFARIIFQRLLQDVGAHLEVRLCFHTPIDLGDTGRDILPLPLLHVELERLEQRVSRILRQILLADRQSGGKISIYQVLARLRRMLQR